MQQCENATPLAFPLVLWMSRTEESHEHFVCDLTMQRRQNAVSPSHLLSLLYRHRLHIDNQKKAESFAPSSAAIKQSQAQATAPTTQYFSLTGQRQI